jgi:hypothetical protein
MHGGVYLEGRYVGWLTTTEGEQISFFSTAVMGQAIAAEGIRDRL